MLSGVCCKRGDWTTRINLKDAYFSTSPASEVPEVQMHGLLENYPKSMLDPRQVLGFTIDSVKKEFSLPAEKVRTIVAEVIKSHTVSARSLAQLIRKMTAAVHPAPLHYRGLHVASRKKGYDQPPSSFVLSRSAVLKHVASRKKGYDGQVTMSSIACKDRAENLSAWNGRAIQDCRTNLVIETGA